MIRPHMPERFRDGLGRWIEHGILPGSFLRAVLSNDLAGAIGKADSQSLRELPGIVCWIYQHAPADCWGSWDRMLAWKKASEERR